MTNIIRKRGYAWWDAINMLTVFVFWLSGNKCTKEDKRGILDIYIPINVFTWEELLGEVKKSRLYPKDKIIYRVWHQANPTPASHMSPSHSASA